MDVAPLIVYFISSFLLVGVLLFLDRYVKGSLQIALRLAIHILSVALFFGFLWYLMTFLMRPCEMDKTLAASIFLGVLLGSVFFYYIGRKNI